VSQLRQRAVERARVKVLGIDPGSRLTGYGLIEIKNGRTSYLASGCIRMRTSTAAERLGEIHAGIVALIDDHGPDAAAVEQVFLARNARSALLLGQARGAALAALASRGVPISEYAARSVKQAITGTGGASKDQIQHMVRALLKLPAAPARDAADALAIAICHINTLGPLSRHTLRR
jgi:crossover junction endodeoxyribonuclease RuvC